VRLQQPHYNDLMNTLKTACYGVWSYACLLLCVLVFNAHGHEYILHGHANKHHQKELLRSYTEEFEKTYHVKGHAEYYEQGHEYRIVVWSTWDFQIRVTNVR
jgi:hypothetical protein